MRFAREQGIPAQGRGSAGDSIVAYVLGITRVDPIRHHLLFERFINEGRTAYPDVDIDFASSRREEVIQYVYERYGEAHTGMVCNLVTYRARSAVREVGYALGFPRPLVDRVAKALETYDSVMVRRDLEAEGGFAEFFRAPGEEVAAVAAGRAGAAQARQRGLVDGMGRLDRPPGHRRLGRRGATDDEGGPGDTPVSVAWLRGDVQAVDPESGVALAGRAPHRRRGDGRGSPRGQHRRPLALGALAGAVRPHRRLPAPPLDPHRRHARDRRAAGRHRARSSGPRCPAGSSSSTTSGTSRRSS